MSIQSLESDLSKSTTTIPGVKVSYDLWEDLKKQNKIEYADFCPVGLPDIKYKLPVIKGTKTILWVDPDLNDKEYTLPNGHV